MLRYAPSVVWN